MPSLALNRISQSVSRGGTCKSNLRGTGANSNKLYDFANPTREFIIDGISSASTSGGGVWSNTIRQAYQADSGVFSNIRYSTLLSSARSGTIMLRVKLSIDPEKFTGGLLFANGTPTVNGYGLYLDSALRLYFIRLDDISMLSDAITISNGSLSNSTWYQFSVRFETTQISMIVNDEPMLIDVTSVVAFQNGSNTIITSFNSAIVQPTAGYTTFFSEYNPAIEPYPYQYVTLCSITDFAFLEAQLTDSQLAAFGTAPYI